ncbi:MAG: hypothetical protein EXX96DRAFT_105868 [Benjaminiella poitrasii]|nr:MAG: hypothetical protein EXX96DRAFT_105868 [Benjaminiella poitrasii]
MQQVSNPVEDGNCGFRCIAHAIYGDENVRFRVKQEMKDWYESKYDQIYKGRVDTDSVSRTLDKFDECPSVDSWFDSVDCPQIDADLYNRAIAVYSETAGNTLFLPFRSEIPESSKPIMLYLSQTQTKHWYLISYQPKIRKIVWPSISPLYEPVRIKLSLEDRSIMYK